MTAPGATATSSSPARLSEALLDQLFLRMAALFGHTWTSQYGRTPGGVAGETWAAALAGLSNVELAHGLREVMKLGGEFPPSAPKFRMLCLGIPSFDFVRHALRTRQSTAFVRLVWEFVDAHALAHADERGADRQLRGAYDLAREYILQGGRLNAEEQVLLERPAPAPLIPADPEKTRAVFDDLAAHFGIKPHEEAP